MNDHPEIFNGLSVNLREGSAEEDAALIGDMPQVKQIWPVKIIPRPQVQREHFAKGPLAVNKREVWNSTLLPHKITQVDRIHKSGQRGQGVKIGIIDTGVRTSVL